MDLTLISYSLTNAIAEPSPLSEPVLGTLWVSRGVLGQAIGTNSSSSVTGFIPVSIHQFSGVLQSHKFDVAAALTPVDLPFVSFCSSILVPCSISPFCQPDTLRTFTYGVACTSVSFSSFWIWISAYHNSETTHHLQHLLSLPIDWQGISHRDSPSISCLSTRKPGFKSLHVPRWRQQSCLQQPRPT